MGRGHVEGLGEPGRGRAWSSDSKAFLDVVRRFGPVVRRVVSVYADSPDDCDDLCQEVWLRVWMGKERLTHENLRAWIIVVARNLCRDELRKRRRHTEACVGVPELGGDESVDPLSRLMRREQQRVIRAVVATLPERQRQAVVLRLYSDLTAAEISERMRITPATARSLVSKGLAKTVLRLRRSGMLA